MRVVIPSVHYADYLAVTLPAWKALLPDGTLCIVTSPDDADSQAVAARCGVPAIITDAWTRRDPDPAVHYRNPEIPVTFNSPLAMDVALGLAEDCRPRPAIGEVIVHIDADGYPQGTWPDLSTVQMDTLYGIERFACDTPEMFAGVLAGRVRHTDYRRMKNSGGRPVGYFQLCRYREGLRLGSFYSAHKYDTKFCALFAKQAYFTDLWAWHLGPQDPENWKGRTVPKWETVSA